RSADFQSFDAVVSMRAVLRRRGQWPVTVSRAATRARHRGAMAQICLDFGKRVQATGSVRRDNGAMPSTPVLQAFHPAVAQWFSRAFPGPTPAQAEAWPRIQAGRHVLVAAPTGSGKTLTAFLAAIDDLVRQGVAGTLVDTTQVLYVSPLKALSNDIHVNLEAPLAGVREALAALGLPDVTIRTAVRTGDTSQAERAALRKQAPHVLVTTPESLYVLLGSESGRAM